MSATSLTRTYERLLTTTSDLIHKRGEVTDNFFQSNPLFYRLHGNKGGVRTKEVEAGGYFIRVNLLYDENGNVDSFDGYDILDDTPQDGITAAFFPWAHYSGANMLDGASKFKNSDKAKIVDLWMEIYNQTHYTMHERTNKDLLDIANITLSTATTGNSGKNLQGLPLMIQNDPTQSYNYGSINQSTGAGGKWRNRTASSTAATGTALYQEMMSLRNTCSRGPNGPPDFYLTDQVTWEIYTAYMNERIRYVSGEVADAGFEAVKFLSADVFWDVYTPDTENSANGADGTTLTAGTMFGINSKCMKLYIGKGFDFAPQGVRKAERQDAYREYLILRGQLVTDQRRKHGVLYGISPAIDPIG